MQSEYSEGWCEMTLEPICHLFWQTDCSRGTFKVLTISFKVSDFESRPCIAQCHYEGTLYLSYRLFLIIRLGLFSTYAIFGRAYFWVMLIFEPCLFSKVTRKWHVFKKSHAILASFLLKPPTKRARRNYETSFKIKVIKESRKSSVACASKCCHWMNRWCEGGVWWKILFRHAYYQAMLIFEPVLIIENIR